MLKNNFKFVFSFTQDILQSSV